MDTTVEWQEEYHIEKTVPLIPRALFQNQWRRTRGKLADPGSPGGNTIHTPV